MADGTKEPMDTKKTGVAGHGGTARTSTPTKTTTTEKNMDKAPNTTPPWAVLAVAVLASLAGALAGYRLGHHHGIQDGWWSCVVELGLVA